MHLEISGFMKSKGICLKKQNIKSFKDHPAIILVPDNTKKGHFEL